jgi:hypothetical protein
VTGLQRLAEKPLRGAHIPLGTKQEVTEVKPIKRILDHIGEPANPPPMAPARGPPHWETDFARGRRLTLT